MALKDLALTPEEAKETLLGYAGEVGDAPKYPYGLSLDLCDETMEKLGLTYLPTVGTEMMLTAVAKVTSTRAYAEQNGAEQSFCLQITKMEIKDPSASRSPASKLYMDKD